VDLVEIAATANPPVCRLMDYGKFKYQEQKKAAEAKSKQTVIEIKEIKFRPGTDDGDYNIKMRNIKRFLAEGDKCKITLRFRGREITHQEIGMALLQRIRDELGDTILVEQFPKLEGRQMIMMIAPGRRSPPARPSPATEAADHGDDGLRQFKAIRLVAAVAVMGGFGLAPEASGGLRGSPNKWLGAIKARRIRGASRAQGREGAFTCPR
jgi:translation initiation factor IF-3